jgi:hypothetical protein
VYFLHLLRAPTFVSAILIACSHPNSSIVAGAEFSLVTPVEECGSNPLSAHRPICIERAQPFHVQLPKSELSGAGTWRLVRTSNPRGGPDAVAVAQTADPLRSDIDFAGLMLRCAAVRFEVVVVLLTPLPPRPSPRVKLTARGSTVDLPATLISPGVLIVLAPNAADLVSGPWTSASELALEVVSKDTFIRGVVSLVGLAPALALLLTNCPLPQ